MKVVLQFSAEDKREAENFSVFNCSWVETEFVDSLAHRVWKAMVWILRLMLGYANRFHLKIECSICLNVTDVQVESK